MKSIAQTTLVQSKQCTSCGIVYPASAEFFHKQKNGRFGFTSKCKQCKNAEIKAWSIKNPEKRKLQKVRWKLNNYEKYLQIKRDDQRRRKYACKEKIDVADWQALLKASNYRCVHCGTTEDITQDHIIPLIHGGANSIDNIQPLCRSCNSKKSSKMTTI